MSIRKVGFANGATTSRDLGNPDNKSSFYTMACDYVLTKFNAKLHH